MKSTTSKQTTVLSIILGAIVFLTAATALIFNYFNGTVYSTTATTTTSIPLQIKQFDLSSLASAPVLDLQSSAQSAVAQVNGIADAYPKPVLPQTITATDTMVGGSALVSWTLLPSNNETLTRNTTIELYRALQVDSHTDLVATITATTTSYLDTNLTNDTTYYYSVRTTRTVAGEIMSSDFSETIPVTITDQTPPLAPTDLNVVPVADQPNILLVQWNNTTADTIASYRIYRSQKLGFLGQAIAEVDASYQQLEDDTVEPGKRYYYMVTAVDTAGNESTTTLLTATPGNDQVFVFDAQAAYSRLYP